MELRENALFEVQGGEVVTAIVGFVIIGFLLGNVRGCAAEDKKNGYK